MPQASPMADAAMTAARALLLLPALSVCAGNAPIGKSTVIVKVVAMLLAVVFPLLAVAAGDASVLLVSSWNSQNTVWRAFASGAAEPVLTLIERETTNEGLFLNGAALPSRNQRLVAFSSRHDLWILDVETGKRTRVTNVGKPYTSTEADVSRRYDSDVDRPQVPVSTPRKGGLGIAKAPRFRIKHAAQCRSGWQDHIDDGC